MSTVVEIALTQGQVALVDEYDVPLLSAFKWQANWNRHVKGYYAISSSKNAVGRRTTVTMHRLIVGAPKGMTVDHLNHHTLDNRRANLRVCTNGQNNRNNRMYRTNRSGFKGVAWNKASKSWQVRIYHDGKQYNLGYVEDPIEGAIRYNEAAIKLHGEFAFLNPIPDTRVGGQKAAEVSCPTEGLSHKK